MSDLIDRQAAIRATWQEPSYTDPLNVLTEVRDRINEIPAASPWHRVEEPPELEELVRNRFYASETILMYDNGYYIGYARSNEKDGPITWIGDAREIAPTHWMPIEPPGEDA